LILVEIICYTGRSQHMRVLGLVSNHKANRRGNLYES